MKQVLIKILRFAIPILVIGSLTFKYYKWTYSTEGFDKMFLEIEQLAAGLVLIITLIIDFLSFKKNKVGGSILPSFISVGLVFLAMYFHFSKEDRTSFTEMLSTEGRSTEVSIEWITLFDENKILYEWTEKGWFGKKEWYWGSWKLENGVYKCQMNWQTPREMKLFEIKIDENDGVLILKGQNNYSDTFKVNLN